MSSPNPSDRPTRSRKLSEKGVYLVQEKVSKLKREAEKIYREAHSLAKKAVDGKTNEIESSFENSTEALASVKKSVEESFDLMAISNVHDEEFIQEMSKLSEWLQDIDHRMEELKKRFQDIPSVHSAPPLWRMAAGKLLEAETLPRKAPSLASTSSTTRARAEAAAAKKRMQLEKIKNELLVKQMEEEVKEESHRREEQMREEAARREEEAKREVAKRKREMELEQMKAEIEYEVAQTRLNALEEGSSRCAESVALSVNTSPEKRCLEDSRMRSSEEGKPKEDPKIEERIIVSCHPTSNHDQTVGMGGDQDWMRMMANTQQALLYGVPKIAQFSGSAEDFFSFMAMWKSTVGAPGGNPAYKLQLLLSHLDVKSRSLIEHCSYLCPGEGYEKAITTLYEKYGRVDVLVDAFLKKMKRYPKIQMNDTQMLESYAELLDRSVLALEELSKRAGSSDYVSVASTVQNVAEILLKLPKRLREKFVKRAGQDSSNIKKLRDFLKLESKEANNPVLRACNELEAKEHAGKTSQKKDEGPRRGGQGSAFSTAVMDCFVCGQDSHPAFKCQSFRQMSAKDRIDLLKKDSRCFNCFDEKHRSRECELQSFCKKDDCGWRSPHSWFVHDREKVRGDYSQGRKEKMNKLTNAQEKKSQACEGKSKIEVTNACESMERKAFFQVVPVRIWTPKRPDACLTCWAMLDPCSSTHFSCKKLADLLGISGQQKKVTLRTMNGTMSQNVITSDIIVAGFEKNEEFKIRSVKFQENDDITRSAVPKVADCKEWPHLEPFVGKVQYDEVLLLIGLEAQGVFQQGSANGPYLVDTGLGRAVQGLVKNGSVSCESVNFVEVEADATLESRVKKFFDIEDCQGMYDDTKLMSVEDRRAMKMIEESIKKTEDRYEVRVPWRVLPPSMPNNRHQALHRINCLRKRFLQDPEGLEEYAKAISDYEVKGFAEKVPEDELEVEEGKASWLCHHGVKHERKALRIVFNASKLCEGKSLNNEIMQGPDLLSKLIGILLRFRRHPVAVAADVKAFFHQVRIPKSDVNFQRYLWFEDSDPRKKIIEMRMLVHLFGGISSQTCSVAALHRCIRDAEVAKKIDRAFADASIRSFYCDDFLMSFRDADEAAKFSGRLKSILDEGSFKLVKFLSTELSVLKDIPKEDIVESCREVSSLDQVQSSALGIQWSVGKDTLSFPLANKIQEEKKTKREVLGFIASIFDPLGILGPVTATAKMILSAIFQRGQGWDDPLHAEESSLFSDWLKSLKVLENFSIERCIEKAASDAEKLELHLFSDGAEPGYGCCAYAVIVQHSVRKVCFLMSKSKICSKKGKLTTPKVELCAAVLASRVARIIRRELKEDFHEVYFWIDSMSTWKMIKNDKTRYKVFEANRLEEIRSCTDSSSWKFVPGKLNPSDLLTRPFSLDGSYRSDHFFFKGPPFLQLEKKHWPEQPVESKEKIEAIECCNLTSSQSWTVVENLFPRVGSWIKLKKLVAVMIRLQRLLRGEERRGWLTVEELLKAEEFIFKIIQEHYFSQEITRVLSCKQLSKNHHLSRYNPFLLDGILRVSGRLAEADIDYDQKHPIILPKDGHVTELIIHSIHQRNFHGTPQMVLNGLRQRFHVPDALRVIKRVIGRCLECKRYSQRLGEQIMANLPSERVATGEPPFTHTGCDVAGPFMVRKYRKLQKRYVCLFTCMTVRAVHLEVIENLEADTFINAFRRFLGRRGPIKSLRTDNALNFRGGDREIREAIEEWNKTDMGAKPEFRNDGIIWNYQTPKASSHSGVWERMIRSMRSHLRHVVGNQEVPEDVFHTLVVEVEAILNSRPLIPASEDPDDLTALTPSMLLNIKQTCTAAPGKFTTDDAHLKKRWRLTQMFVDYFWKRFSKEYLSTLLSRQKWVRKKRDFKEGDVVLIADELLPRSHWPIGRVVQVYPGKDLRVRSCQIKTKAGVYDRPINKLALMEMD